MKKKYLIVGSFAFMQLISNAQVKKDSSEVIPNKTDIEVVYNHYLQNGNNSAVTGGIGTEKLTVYGPALHLKNTFKNKAILINAGADIISSASTDKIDYVVSSASILDSRVYLNGNYSADLQNKNLTVNGGAGFSIESDYLSVSGNIGFTKKDKQNLRSFSIQLHVFNDDLRWGRLDSRYQRPVKLIYPEELRYKSWFDTYKRMSYDVKVGITQILNKRTTIGIFPEFSYQKGLLSTPFHRVYFSDASVVVENLPGERYKFALALKGNIFLGGAVIIKNSINGYTDNFGIRGASFENETAIKAKPFLTLLPNVKIYTQEASRYFAPYRKHTIGEEFYTSDYDLSSFRTYNVGVGIKYSPQKYLTRRFLFNAATLRYNYLYRTNNLRSHIISLIIQTTRFKRLE